MVSGQPLLLGNSWAPLPAVTAGRAATMNLAHFHGNYRPLPPCPVRGPSQKYRQKLLITFTFENHVPAIFLSLSFES